MNIAAIIIGIDNWSKYTLPLIESIYEHEPDCLLYIVDNASQEPYPDDGTDDHLYATAAIYRTEERLCYSKAINFGKSKFGVEIDWIIVLSNDVLCTGSFAHMLERQDGEAVIGPLMKQIHIERVGLVDYVEGWAVAIPRRIWDTIGGWDERMQISSYEDVEYSHRARMNGFWLEQVALPFVHLDQKQRFNLVPDYWSSEAHNRARFIEKYAQAVAV